MPIDYSIARSITGVQMMIVLLIMVMAVIKIIIKITT